jgi:hypothetical protein
MNQSIKKHFAITLGKHNAFVPGNCGLRSLSQYGQTKICKASALQRSGPFHQFLCLGIHTKTKARTAHTAFLWIV